MKRHRRNHRLIILFVFGITVLFVLGAADAKTNLIQAYEIQIANQKEVIEKLTKENTELKVKVGNLQTNFIDDLSPQEVIKYYKETGYTGIDKDGKVFNPYCRDLAHLKNVWEYSKKYQYLLTPEAKRVCFEQNIDPVRFTFCWCHKETHYNPDKDFYNSNGTVDHNITQVNDCEWDLLYKQLPKDLLKRTNPKHDSEIGIAMLYLWINDRTKNRWCWCYLNDEAWTLYWRIGELKKCMQN